MHAVVGNGRADHGPANELDCRYSRFNAVHRCTSIVRHGRMGVAPCVIAWVGDDIDALLFLLDYAVHYLERDEYVLKGVRFLGCCLWTDYRLDTANPLTAMRHAQRELNDHRVIRTELGRFTPQDALQIHQNSRAWLEKKLDESFDGPTVVVTHHGPHPNSVHPRFEGAPLNAAFVSDLTPLIEQADLWIHGHVHDSFDYEVAQTRVIANPRGYPSHLGAKSADQLEWENEAFNPALVIEI